MITYEKNVLVTYKYRYLSDKMSFTKYLSPFTILCFLVCFYFYGIYVAIVLIGCKKETREIFIFNQFILIADKKVSLYWSLSYMPSRIQTQAVMRDSLQSVAAP